jgi:hypothetical protein
MLRRNEWDDTEVVPPAGFRRLPVASEGLRAMQVRFFQIPTAGCEAVEAEMNAFLRA